MSPHFRPVVAAFVACLAIFAARTATAADAPLPATFAEPSVSPDHSEIAFLSGGDIWSVASNGGVARLLADTGGYAERPLFSPDGKHIAFVSTRPGDVGIEVLDLVAGRLHRITYDESPPELDSWSRNAQFLYFSSSDGNVGYAASIYRVPAAGGTPVVVRGEAYVNSMDGAPSPSGARLAYVRNGFDQWWRRGHSHIDTSSITIVHGSTQTFDRVTDGTSKDRWPMWSLDGDGRDLYYVSDRSGNDELWLSRDGKTRQVTTLGPGRVVWPTISWDGHLIAFERGMAIWTYDTASGATHALAIEPRGLSATLQPARQTLTRSFGAFDLSPDGKKLAFIARGGVFAVDAAEGGEGQAIPMRDVAAADEPVWAHDNRSVAYVLDRGDEQAIDVRVPGRSRENDHAGRPSRRLPALVSRRHEARVRARRARTPPDRRGDAERSRSRARDLRSPSVRRRGRRRVLARRRLARVRRQPARRFCERVRRPGGRRHAARDHRAAEHEHGTARVGARRLAAVRRHLAAIGGRRRRPSRPRAARAALPRGHVPLALRRDDAEDEGAIAGDARAERRTGGICRTRKGETEAAHAHRLHRHHATRHAAADGPRRRARLRDARR
jgi:Tol biopolymer transport system component